MTSISTNMNTKPLVSVVMPVYNAEAYLKDAVESMLYQTYPAIELIIVDDHSTDNSWEILKSYKEQFPTRIKLIRTKKNLNCGGDTCANYGISKAIGKYIARMDADDIAVPNRIEKQVAYLESHPGVTLVGSQAYVINGKGETIGEKMNQPATLILKKHILPIIRLFTPQSWCDELSTENRLLILFLITQTMII
jgi:glycosyltransferase involved in cell wall biosynthesis